MTEEFNTSIKFVKVDQELGLIFGFAIICKQNGEAYFDTQGDHIPENAMLEAATDFMKNSRVSKEMHEGDKVGEVLFAFPLTEDIAKAFEIQTQTTGLMVAVRPENNEIIEKFKSGEYTGFSIGGTRIQDDSV